MSKIFERILADQLTSFLIRTNFFHEGQYGFIHKRNTTQAAMKVVNFITDALNNGEYAIGIFLDIKKAFDSVDWNILFAKLEHYGIRGRALKLFKSYFSN